MGSAVPAASHADAQSTALSGATGGRRASGAQGRWLLRTCSWPRCPADRLQSNSAHSIRNATGRRALAPMSAASVRRRLRLGAPDPPEARMHRSCSTAPYTDEAKRIGTVDGSEQIGMRALTPASVARPVGRGRRGTAPCTLDHRRTLRLNRAVPAAGHRPCLIATHECTHYQPVRLHARA